jgi:hypothetical protein
VTAGVVGVPVDGCVVWLGVVECGVVDEDGVCLAGTTGLALTEPVEDEEPGALTFGSAPPLGGAAGVAGVVVAGAGVVAAGGAAGAAVVGGACAIGAALAGAGAPASRLASPFSAA